MKRKKIKGTVTFKEDNILYWREIVQYSGMTRASHSPVKVRQIDENCLIAEDVHQFVPEYLYGERLF